MSDNPDHNAAKFREFNAWPTQKLREQLALGQMGENDARIARLVLDQREAEESSEAKSRDIALAEEGNSLAEEANRLARLANEVASKASTIASRANAIAFAAAAIAVVSAIAAIVALQHH